MVMADFNVRALVLTYFIVGHDFLTIISSHYVHSIDHRISAFWITVNIKMSKVISLH